MFMFGTSPTVELNVMFTFSDLFTDQAPTYNHKSFEQFFTGFQL